MDINGEMQIVITGRTNVKTVDDTKRFLTDFYDSSGSTFNVRSGRADRKGKETVIWGHRKCIMQVQEKKETKPKRKGLHQDCGAELNFKLKSTKVILIGKHLRVLNLSSPQTKVTLNKSSVFLYFDYFSHFCQGIP